MDRKHERQVRAQLLHRLQRAVATALDAVTQAKLRSAQVHDQIAVAKAQNSIQLKSLSTVAGIHQSAARTAADATLKTITTAHDIHMDRAKQAAKPKAA